jgi:ABC-type uncharacterized transport system permease subunit
MFTSQSPLLGIFAIILYLTTSSLLTVRLVRGPDTAHIDRFWIMIFGFSAVILHASVLYPSLFTPSGLNLGLSNAASLVGFLTALLLLLASTYKPVENLGIPLLPLAALTIGLMFVYPAHLIIGREESSWQLDSHILLSVLAYSVLGMAALQAILLAIQDHHLHNRQPGGFIRSLPPLQTMEEMLFQMIGIGFVLLSLALVTGVLFLEDIFAQHLVHKTVLSIAAWTVFAVLLWGRRRFGWRGRVAIRWTIGGFVFLMLAYFGTKVVLELILKR